MTIASQTSRITYTGDGSTTAFAVPFYFASNADIVVTFQDTSGNAILQSLGTNYNLSGATVSSGGTCTFITAPTSGYTISIYRDPPVTQTTSYNNNDPFPAKSHELALDKLTTLAQRTKDIALRSIRIPESEASTITTLATIASRKNKLLGFGNSGEIIYPLGPTYVGTTSLGTAQVDSRSTALVTKFDPAINIIVTRGYATPGDGGEAVYAYSGTTSGDLVVTRTDNVTQAGFNLKVNEYNFKQFGAKADGATDDTAAWQAAINYVNGKGGGVVRVPYGTTLLAGSVQVKGGVTIEGRGFNTVVKLANSAVGSLYLDSNSVRCWIYADTATGIGLDNFVLDGNNANNPGTTLRGVSFQSCSDVVIRRVVIGNTYGTAIGFGTVTTFEIVDCRFHDLTGNFPATPGNPGEGIYMRDATDGLVRGIRGVNIDDHLIYIDGGSGNGTDSVAVINAIARNAGRVSQASAFNVFQNSKKVTFTDCHATVSGAGFSCNVSVDGTLVPVDITYNACTVQSSFGTSGCDGFTANGTTGRVLMRLKYNNCSSIANGGGNAVVANGFNITGIDDVELNACSAENNNDNGVLLTNVTNFKVDGRMANNSRRSAGAFDGVRIGTASAGTQCTTGIINVNANDTAASGKLQGYGVQILGTSDSIDITGRLSGNLTGTLLVGGSATNCHWSGVAAQGTNANGTYIRYADGVQECWVVLDQTTTAWSTALGAFFTPASAQTWTFPIAFIDSSSVVTGNVMRASTELSGVQIAAATTTSVSYIPHSSSNLNSSTGKFVNLWAVGRWY